MPIRRTLAMLMMAANLSGCGTSDQAQRSMQTTWIGKRADDFFVKHGAAQNEQKLSDGRRVYIWSTVANASMGGPKTVCGADVVASPSGVIVEIRPREDTLGIWNTSRCAEIFSSS